MSEKENLEIDLRRVLFALWNHIWIIALVGVLVAALAFGYAYFFVTPMYAASAQLYVNNNYVDSPGFTSSQVMAAQALADTYMVILESRSVLDEVAEETGLGYSYGELRGMVSAAAVNETEVFEVTVTCANHEHAALIANAIADTLPERIAAVVEGSSVRVVDYATESDRQVSPVYSRYAVLGAVIGVLISAVLIVVIDLMDTSINSEEYLVRAYGDVPLLAVIPGAKGSKNGYYKGYYRGYYESKENHAANRKSGGDA